MISWLKLILRKKLWGKVWFGNLESAQKSIDYSKCEVPAAAAAAAKSLQSCLTLCDPIDGSPPGSPVPGILQARTLEWVAISFSNAWKWKVKVKSLSSVRHLATPWTAAYQAPPFMGFARQEYWSGLPLTFWGTSKLFSQVMAPFCTLILLFFFFRFLKKYLFLFI